MSAPQTNLEIQKRRHRGPIIGFLVVVALVLGLLFWQLVVLADGAPSSSDPVPDVPAADQADAVPDPAPGTSADPAQTPAGDLPSPATPTPAPDLPAEPLPDTGTVNN